MTAKPPLTIPPAVAIKALRRFIDCNWPQWSHEDYVAEWTAEGVTIRELAAEPQRAKKPPALVGSGPTGADPYKENP